MAAPEKLLWEASRGQNAHLRGQKSKNLPKIADFCHFFPSDWGASGEEPPTNWGAYAPSCPHGCASVMVKVKI